jgi:hypothetical protein
MRAASNRAPRGLRQGPARRHAGGQVPAARSRPAATARTSRCHRPLPEGYPVSATPRDRPTSARRSEAIGSRPDSSAETASCFHRSSGTYSTSMSTSCGSRAPRAYDPKRRSSVTKSSGQPPATTRPRSSSTSWVARSRFTGELYRSKRHRNQQPPQRHPKRSHVKKIRHPHSFPASRRPMPAAWTRWSCDTAVPNRCHTRRGSLPHAAPAFSVARNASRLPEP